jgi:hypothetical protein
MNNPANLPTNDSQLASALTPEALREKLEDLYPPNATDWSQATGEVRDLCRGARVALDLDDDHAVNFYALRTPSAYNTEGINGIIRFYEQMSEAQRVGYVRQYQHLWTPEA